MCGIYGILLLDGAVPSPEHRGIIKRLALKSQIRGRDATGLSFAKEDGVFTIKHNCDAKEFVKMSETIDIINDGFNPDKNGKLYSVIGHTRQWTQGRPENNGNNHPIRCGAIIGVHNGAISNDASIYEWLLETTKGKIKRAAEVDSEAIFALINYHANKNKEKFYSAPFNTQTEHKTPVVNAIIKSVPSLRGSMACAVQDIENPKIAWLFRTSNPLTIHHYETENTIVFASTANIVKSAVEPAGFSKPIDIPIDGDQGMCFNLENSTYHSFTLDSSSGFSY